MPQTSPKIGWEKWKSPYDLSKDKYNDEYNDEKEDVLKNQYALLKTFNFWTGHTNFRITREIAKIVEDTNGVEVLAIISPYRMHVGIGKMFNSSTTRHVINKNLYQYLARREVKYGTER
jgi:hypothetical protein